MVIEALLRDLCARRARRRDRSGASRHAPVDDRREAAAVGAWQRPGGPVDPGMV